MYCYEIPACAAEGIAPACNALRANSAAAHLRPVDDDARQREWYFDRHYDLRVVRCWRERPDAQAQNGFVGVIAETRQDVGC